MITITDAQIQQIAEQLQDHLYDADEGRPYELEQIIPMVENWLLRSISGIEQSPWWHVSRSSDPLTALAKFEEHPRCEFSDWGRQCKSEPMAGSVFCEAHQPKEPELEFYNFVTGQTVRPEPWQRELKVGDYYCIEQPGAAFVDASGYVEDLGTGPAIYGHIEQILEPGFFWVRAYSQACPEGEVGQMNICDPTRKITEEEFNRAKAEGWPE